MQLSLTRRPCGFSEALYAYLHEATLGGAQIVVAAEVFGPITRRSLRSSLGIVADETPMLRTCFEAEGDTLLLRHDDAGGAPDVVLETLDSPTDVVAACEEALDDPLTNDGPLWRCSYRPSTAPSEPTLIVLTVHHGITDGLGVLYLMGRVLECVASPPPVLRRGPDTIPDPVEALLPPGGPRRKNADARPSQWPYNRDVPSATRRNRVAQVDLPAAQRALHAAWTRGVTAQFLFSALLASAVFAHRPDDRALICNIPTSLRRNSYGAPDQQHLGVYVVSVPIQLQREAFMRMDLWHRARTLQDAFRRERQSTVAGLQDLAQDDARQAVDRMQYLPAFSTAANITISGSFPQTVSTLRVHRLVGASSQRSRILPFLATVNKLGDDYSVIYNWCDPDVHDSDLHTMLHSMDRELQRLFT